MILYSRVPRTWCSRDAYHDQRKKSKDRQKKKQEQVYYSDSHGTFWTGGWWQPRGAPEWQRLKGSFTPQGVLGTEKKKNSSKNWIKRVSLIKYDQNWWLWRCAHELVALMRYWQGSLSSPGDHRHPQKQLHAVTRQAWPQLPSLIFTMWLLVFHYPTSKTWKKIFLKTSINKEFIWMNYSCS